MSKDGSAIEARPVAGEAAAPAPAAAPAKKRVRRVTGARTPRLRRGRREPVVLPSLVLWVVGLTGVALMAALVFLVASREVESIADPADPARLTVSALLILGPLAFFWALARGMRMGFFWLFGTAAWAGFGYLLIFLQPPPPAQAAALHYALFLGALALALVALLTPPLYALGWVIFSQRQRQHDLGRAARQATLIAAYIVLLIGMNLFGVFNWLNALLLFVVFALAEFFFLSRG